jgi:hypothetical protein
MDQRNRFRRYKIAMPVFALVAALLLGVVIQWLWNAILPSVAHFNPITYWQAVGLFVLCKILFGGFRGGHPGGYRGKWRRFNGKFDDDTASGPWAWKNKWMKMTHEERLRFRQEMHNRFRKPPGNI